MDNNLLVFLLVYLLTLEARHSTVASVIGLLANPRNDLEPHLGRARRSSDLKSDAESWSKLQISPNTLGSMPYGGFRINVYEHADNSRASTPQERKRYFYAPIGLLRHSSATSSFNNVTNEPEVNFTIDIWNDEIEKEIVAYASVLIRHEIRREQVEVLPFGKVILTLTQPSETYRTISQWLPYQYHQSIDFKLVCDTQDVCDKLAQNMRFNPRQFSHLKLQFSLDSQSTGRRELSILAENIVAGKTIASLVQRFPDKTEALLTAKDTKRLLNELTNNIIVESLSDNEVIAPTSEAQVYKILENMIVSSRMSSANLTNRMWDLLFWDDDNYRPDRLSQSMNEIHDVLDAQSRRNLVKEWNYGSYSKAGVDVKIPFVKIPITAMHNMEKISTNDTAREETLRTLFKVANELVIWNGEKFEPKPLDLVRISLNVFSESHKYHERKLYVKYYVSILSVGVNFDVDLPVHSKYNDRLFQMSTELKALRKEVNDTTEALQSLTELMTTMHRQLKNMSNVSQHVIARLIAGDAVRVFIKNVYYGEYLIYNKSFSRKIGLKRNSTMPDFIFGVWNMTGTLRNRMVQVRISRHEQFLGVATNFEKNLDNVGLFRHNCEPSDPRCEGINWIVETSGSEPNRFRLFNYKHGSFLQASEYGSVYYNHRNIFALIPNEEGMDEKVLWDFSIVN